MTTEEKKQERICECTCGCTEPATTTDDSGVAVCAECAEYITANGDVVCGRMVDLGQVCHICDVDIDWGPILTGDPGTGEANHRYGSCACGDGAWVDEELGDWGNYRYGVEE